MSCFSSDSARVSAELSRAENVTEGHRLARESYRWRNRESNVFRRLNFAVFKTRDALL